MDDAVQSTTLEPLHTALLERFTLIALDVTPTKLHRSVTVLYVATDVGLLKKISVLPRTQETCIVEVWGPLPSTPITLQFLKDTQSLYVGTEFGLLRIPAAQCHRHRTRQSCLNAQEPYCGWNEHLMKCAPAPKQNHLANHWHQEVTKCPVLTDPVDGGWSAWSSWSPCQHGTAEHSHSHSHSHLHSEHAEAPADICQCQTRDCNNPPPQHGGAPCTGARVRVTNCTVHGEWTAWSAWSACSQTCGFAMKTRRRTCTNPAPAFGGRVCVGHDHDDNICIDLPPCPAKDEAPPPESFGQWSPWGGWTLVPDPATAEYEYEGERARILRHESLPQSSATDATRRPRSATLTHASRRKDIPDGHRGWPPTAAFRVRAWVTWRNVFDSVAGRKRTTRPA